MKYCRLLTAFVLLIQLAIFQLMPATAAGNPLLLLDYTEIDDTHFVVDFVVSDVPEVDVIAIPLTFNNAAVRVCGYNSQTGEFYDIVDGVKTADDFFDAKNGIVLYDALVGQSGWNGVLVENELYPYISNSEEIIRFTAFNISGDDLEGQNKVMSVYFEKISDEEPKIRIATRENAVHYDRASARGISFVRMGDLVNVQIQYSGDVFDGDYKAEIPNPETENNTANKGNVTGGNAVVKPEKDSDEEKKQNQESEKNTDEKIVFTDIENDFWAYTHIMNLAQNKIINGYDNNVFKPNNFITRAELAKIAVLAKKIDALENMDLFTDVNIKSWYAPYLTAAYKNNIITGYPDKTFKPDNNVSRQDLCVILYRAFFEDEAFADSQNGFADEDKIADYAKNAVSYLASKEILSGRENNIFAPTDNATRAETAKIVYLCLEASKN